jgi:hypothetical protein
MIHFILRTFAGNIDNKSTIDSSWPFGLASRCRPRSLEYPIDKQKKAAGKPAADQSPSSLKILNELSKVCLFGAWSCPFPKLF